MPGRSTALPTRRAFLGVLPGAALALTGMASARAADGLSGTALGESPPTLKHPALLVAGPADTAPARWAHLLAPRLTTALAAPAPLQVSSTGGRDGVTGANTFDTQTTPDGSTALLVPGAAAMAWLAGDPRVHFDAGRWVPALASLSPGVLVGRVSGDSSLAGREMRVAASTITGPELPAFLGLSLLGANPRPVFELSEPAEVIAALRSGRIDAAFLTGADVPARQRQMEDSGLVPIFRLGDVAAKDDPGSPSFPAGPTFGERFSAQNGTAPTGPLFEAFRATAAAAQLDVALVLPMLAPPALVARWRVACEAALGDPGLVAALHDAEVAAWAAPECVEALARINADETTQLSLRRWLAARPEWQRA